MTDQDRARRQRYRVRRRAVGGCVSCAQPALPGRTRCATHAAKHRLSAGPAKKGYQAVTREQVLADVQAVAQRLHVRIVTTRLYQREGSFCLTSPLRRRIGSWSALCVEAGLLPTYRGCRGIDRRPCKRCGKVCVWYGLEQRWCPACRDIVQTRTSEVAVYGT